MELVFKRNKVENPFLKALTHPRANGSLTQRNRKRYNPEPRGEIEAKDKYTPADHHHQPRWIREFPTGSVK